MSGSHHINWFPEEKQQAGSLISPNKSGTLSTPGTVNWTCFWRRIHGGQNGMLAALSEIHQG
ncbi:hypothetical protein CS542_06735 [Pedobacter sp. IW39]|nr:hypothetical protein CS542_06735 [Pedobacter sp. IW39]